MCSSFPAGALRPRSAGRVRTRCQGFTGYAVASLLAAVLFDAWQLPLIDRLVGAFAPPLAFLVVLAVVRTIVGRERIVFYQAATSGVALADVTSVSIRCMGPAISIALSGPWGWTFDPTQEMQTFAGSIAMQDVVLTVSGSELTGASVNGMEATLGQPAQALALPLGTSMVPVAVTARSGLSKTYQLVFDRGGAVLQQAVYGKASNTGASDNFGFSVALSGDTLAIGALREAS